MLLESEFQKRYSATFCIYKAIDARSRITPGFLYRNLRHSLDFKGEELKRSRGRKTINSRSAIPQTDLYSTAMSERTHWPPSKDEFDLLARPPTLLVAPREIHLRGTAELDQPIHPDTALEWLPASGWQPLACDITCALSQEDTSWRTLWQSTCRGTLLCASSPEKGARAVVQIDAPFAIPAAALNTRQRQSRRESINKDDHNTITTKSVNQRIRLQLSCIKPSAVRDLNLIFGVASDADRTTLKSYITKLDDFKDGPDFRTCDLGSELQNYVMRVELNWDQPPESTIVSSINQARSDLKHSLATKTIITPDATPKAYKIRYVFTDTDAATAKTPTRSVTVENLACPFCPSRAPHTSFDRLRMHYVLSHDHFRFDIAEQREVEGVLNVAMRVEVQDPRTAERISNDTLDPREMDWMRPARPFDMQRFLKGTDSWDVGPGHPKKTAHKSPSGDTGVMQSIGSWGPKAPDAVEKFEPRRPKRFTVPSVPGVVLYRSLNKRKLRAGEELSESDEYSDTETWAARKQRKRTPPILGHTRGAFFEIWDTFIRRELIGSDRHVTDATVRFCQKYKRELKKTAMNKDFKLKLQQLRLTGRITDEVRHYCEQLVDGETAPGPIEDEQQRKREIREFCDLSDANESEVDTQVDVYGEAHPLTAHPKVQRLLNGQATHPEVNPYLSALVLGGELGERASTLAILDTKAYKSLEHMCKEIGNGHYTNGHHLDSSDDELRPASKKAHLSYHKWNEMLNLQSRQPVRLAKGPVKMRGGLCICGRAAEQDRGIIMCSNAHCGRGTFHLACVNLEERDPEWKCKACSKGTSRERDTEWVTKAEEGAQYLPLQANGH